MFADENVPATVRADVDASGVVESESGVGVDHAAVLGFLGNSLSGLDFPDL